jgi:hypothetical protein
MSAKVEEAFAIFALSYIAIREKDYFLCRWKMIFKKLHKQYNYMDSDARS